MKTQTNLRYSPVPLFDGEGLQPLYLHWNNPWNREIWFPRLIVVPVYSQEVAGVRKEKERLTAAPNPEWGSVEDLGCSGFLFLHSYTRCNLILTVRGCKPSPTLRALTGGERSGARANPIPTPRHVPHWINLSPINPQQVDQVPGLNVLNF